MGALTKRFPRYRRLLTLYPAAYRRHYRDEMLTTLTDMLDAAPTRKERLAVWLRVAADLPVSLTRENIAYIGGVMTNDTPAYVKKSSLAGAALLLPFFILIAAHSMDGNLQHSVLWQFPALFACFVILPSLAFLLATVALVSWLAERSKKEHQNWLRELLDMRRNWHLLAVLLVGIGIVGLVYGHDSAHCVTDNPIRELRNPRL